MGYLTETRLSNIIDLPVSLPATELKISDWLVVSSIRIDTPMRLTVRLLELELLSSTVSVSDIVAANRIFGNLGLAYLVLRKDYLSGTPGAAGALDSLVATDLGRFARDITQPVLITDPGTYSWLIVNNTQPSDDASVVITTSTSIDFVVSVTGSVRLELDHL
jgi:hypothetical protein